ncbi:MAG: hypothetical protein H9W81_12340 [Enterococcus sp.]|nr:hypothetical protein [Enterococcus sp.]
MKLGTTIALIVIGAVLSFAVTDSIAGVDLTMVGYICIAGGVLGMILVLLTDNRRRVSETRTVADPATGESVTRNETKGNAL